MTFNVVQLASVHPAVFARPTDISRCACYRICMKFYRISIVTLVLCLCASTAAFAQVVPADLPQPTLREFADRLPGLHEQITPISEAATASAERILEHQGALLHVPYSEETGLGDELSNRAGGLAIAAPYAWRRKMVTENDVVLISVRAWDVDGQWAIEKLAEYKKDGWMTTLIASRAGAPDNLGELGATFFIDNGAPDGSAQHGRINVLANTAAAWMWCCEYVAGMTRKGKLPGILISVGIPGGKAHDRPIQTKEGRLETSDTEIEIPAGELASMYHARLKTLVADLATPWRQAQVDAAADVVADYLNRGRKVVVSGVGHLITGEQGLDHKSPFEGRHSGHVKRGELARDFEPDDLLIWIGYSGGPNSLYTNYGKLIEESGLNLVTSHTPDPRLEEADMGKLTPLAHIDQSWSIGDAEVRMSIPPGHLAPISGINAMLVLRMLDDEVAARIKSQPTKAEQLQEAEAVAN